MSELRTLSRKDSDFNSYLLGSFSKKERALPVQSLNIGSEEESVTFRIQSIDSIVLPNGVKKYFEILKLKLILMVLFPMFLVFFAALKSNANLDLVSFALACVGGLFLQIGLNLRNDFVDYVHGTDRTQLDSMDRPLQLGWLAAWQVKKLSWIFLTLSFLLSLPVYFFQIKVLPLVLAITFVAYLTKAFFKNSYKYKLFHEFFLFLFLGPGLFCGLQLALGLSISIGLILLSIVWSWLCIYFVYLKYFENLVPNAQFKNYNTIHWLGFERAKIFLIANWVCFVGLFWLYDFYFGLEKWSPIYAMLLLIVSAPFVNHLWSLRSPLGSAQKTLQKNWYRVFAAIIFLWVLREIFIWRQFGGG